MLFDPILPVEDLPLLRVLTVLVVLFFGFGAPHLAAQADDLSPKQGWLGVQIRSATEDDVRVLGLPRALGVSVVAVSKGGPAEKGGILPGDVILIFNGEAVEKMRPLIRMITKVQSGVSVPVTVWRERRKTELRVTLGDQTDRFRIERQAAEQGDASAQFNLGAMYTNGRGVEKDNAEAVRWFRAAAEQGHAGGQNYLAAMYQRGVGVDQDDAAAVKWYRKAAEQGNAYAQDNLGAMYRHGKGVAKDDAEAVRWHRKAAEKGLADAQFTLGWMYDNGRGVATDGAEAARWYHKASEQGHAGSQFNLAMMYANGRGVAKDKAKAVRLFREAAELGLASAQNHLASMYWRGTGVTKDDAAAVKWYRKAAEQGHIGAQNGLGWMYRNGKGVAKDDAAAARWYRKAAEQGHTGAQNYLGVMYGNGIGVEKDNTEAVRWYRKAAEQGHVSAQFNLGAMYNNGEGVAQDFTEAVRWYRIAAEQGYAKAQNNLGVRYRKGEGVAQDDTEAVRWYRKAAEQGQSNAQNNLGIMYQKGLGVPQSYAEAYFWYLLAAARGDENARKNRDILGKKLSSSENAQMQRRAVAWKPVKDKPRGTARDRSKSAPATQVARAAAVPRSTRFPEAPVDVTFQKGVVRPDDIAVIIGNADYGKLGRDIPNVIPAHADAESFKRYALSALGVREGNIIHLRDATSAQLAAVFGSASDHRGRLFNWTRPGISRLTVYYAGHGAPAGQDGSALLVPVDADAASIDLTGYPLSRLYANLSKIPAKSITVVLEACFSGTSQAGSLVSNASPVFMKSKAPKTPRNITVIAAGAPNQMASWEQDKSHGLFTKYYLKGMSGDADQGRYGNKDGTVSMKELNAYLKDSLTYYARRYYGRDQTAQIVLGR